MVLSRDKRGWEDYIYWPKNDKNILRRINQLFDENIRSPFDGKGKPEMLKSNLQGYLSRRINDEHLLVYKMYDDRILIIQCRFHY